MKTQLYAPGVQNPKADGSFKRAPQWQDETEKLRSIVLGCKLMEDVKWGWPCYSADGHNIVLIHAFKKHCALLFFKGALLTDPKKRLVAPGENSQSSRQMRFTSVQEVVKSKSLIKTYVAEAMDVEKAGLKVELKKTSDYAIPPELQDQFKQHPPLKTAFFALTPGRQRAYLLHFAAPKQSKTRTSRIEKAIKRILDGKGMNDS